MSSKTDSNIDNPLYNIYDFLSYEQKIASDCAWIKQSGNYIDNYARGYAGYNGFIEFKRKARLNYDMVKGRGKDAVNEYMYGSNEYKFASELVDEGYSLNDMDYKYWDITSPLFKSMVGEQQKRKLEARAIDTSGYNVNVRKKKSLQLYQEYMQANTVKKYEEQATREILMKHGIKNPLDLKPEEQQQVKSEIDALVKFRTPKDIDKYMRNEYKSPSEIQLQGLVEWYIKHFNIKFLSNEAFKHFLTVGIEVARQGVRNNNIFVELLNPMGFNYSGKQNSFFIDDGDWWSYEEGTTLPSLIGDYGLQEKHINLIKDKVRNVLSGNGLIDDGVRRQISGDMPEHMIKNVATINMATDGAFLRDAPSPNTFEGQKFLQAVYAVFGSGNPEVADIRTVNLCFSAFDKVHFVRRLNKDKDEVQGFWVGENYEFNPETDYDIYTTWARALYEVDKFGRGTENCIFHNPRRVEFQSRDLNNPFDVASPYTGVVYSKMFDNSPLVAPVDFVKPYQYEYCILKNVIEDLERTDIGNVLALPDSLVPHEWSYGKYTQMMKRGKLAPLDTNSEDLNPSVDPSLLKPINLTNEAQIQHKTARLKDIRAEAEISFSYSPSQMGQAPASMTATNNQQNIIQGSYKTEDIYSLHAIFERNLIEKGANLTRNALRDNPKLKSYLLDDLGIAALELEQDVLDLAQLGIEVINSSEEIREVDGFKNLIQPLIQNQQVSSSETIKMQFAKSPATLLNIAEEAEENAKRAAEQARQDQIKEQDANRKHLQALKDKEIAFEKWKVTQQLKAQMYGYELDQLKFQKAADADDNKVPDVLEKAAIDNRTKILLAEMDAEQHQKDIDVQYAKIKADSKNKSLASAKQSK